MTKQITVGQRIQMAVDVLFRRKPYMVSKSSPFLWPSWRQGQAQWQMVDYMAYVEEGFTVNSLIYASIMYKVKAQSYAPLRAYQMTPDGKQEALPPDHPLSVLCARPNKSQSWSEFQSLLEVYLNLHGNAYVLLDRGSPRATTGDVVAMYPLRPDRVSIIPDKRGGLLGYLYKREGETQKEGLAIVPENMIHVKLPNPGDPLEGMGYGLSPIAPLARYADVDNAVSTFFKLFFDNGAMPAGVLSFPDPLDDATVEQIKYRWQERYGGVQHWTDIGVLDHGGTYNRAGATLEELGFNELDMRNEARVAMPFGVPPILIGMRVGLERSTYSNYEEARRQFWEDTFLPELNLFEVEYEYYLGNPDTGVFVQFDKSEVPALRDDITQQVQAAYQMWRMGVPANMAFDTVGLNIEPVPGGDVSYVEMGVMPRGEDGAALEERPSPFGDNGSGSNNEDEPSQQGDDERSIPFPKVRPA